MKKFGRISAVAGLIILLSVPLTLFLDDWRLGLVAVVKIVLGALALLLWPLLDAAGMVAAVRRRSFFFSMIDLLSALLALGAVVIVNCLAYSFPWRVDLTRNKVFSLSDQTRALISGLDDDLELLAFYGPDEPEYRPLDECFDRYRRLSDHFSARLIDPVRRQDLVKRYKVSAGGPRLVLLYRNRRARARIARRLRGCPEQAIANAILSLTSRNRRPPICFLYGHGESGGRAGQGAEARSLFTRDLEDGGFQTRDISLLELGGVPSECRVLVIAGPERDISMSEQKSIDNYLDSGGRLLAFLGAADSRSLDALLAGYDLQLDRDTVVSGGRSPVLVASDPASYQWAHPVFKRLLAGTAAGVRRLQAVLPLARSVRRLSDANPQRPVVELFSSSRRAWGETDKPAVGDKHTFDAEHDLPGPVPLAVALDSPAVVKGAVKPAGPRMIVFGSSLMLDDSAYRLFPLNRDLIVASLNWLSGDDGKIVIRPRYREATLLKLDQSQLELIAVVSTDLLPLLILVFGFCIWLARRWS